MEFSSFSVDVNSLSTLLSESRSVGKDVVNGNQIMQPPMELGASKIVTKIPQAAKVCEAPAKNSNIWSGDEIPSEDSVLSTTKDNRPQPKYEFSYKQEIGTQDTFLGISGKTPGSMDCTHLVIKVHFPGCKMLDLDLDVTRNRIKAESPRHKLFAYLPTAVRHEEGVATFDKSKEVLTVVLPIINELFE